MVSSREPANDTLLPALTAICGAGFARPAGPGDAVAEVPARWVAAPGSVAAVTETMRLASRHRLAVVPRGAGSKLDWGTAPTRVDLILDTGRLVGIRQDSPDGGPAALGAAAAGAGGLVAEVRAGTLLRLAQSSLARSGQRIPLDPASPDATVGGVIATDEAGPLRHRFGAPREQLIGVSYVRADGTVTTSSGRIARGTSGQDVDRLLFGSNGALGILVSATFRVHPAPAARIWVSRSVSTPLEVHDLVGEALAGQLAPAAVEVDLPTSSGTLSILLEGAPERVDARAEQAAAVLGGGAWISAAPPPWWGRYPFTASDVALKLAVPISDLHAVVYALRDAAGATVPVRGSAGVGVVYAALPGSTAPERVAAVLAAVRGVLVARGGSCVVLTAPARVRTAIDVWGEVSGRGLLRQVKRRFDPEGLLAPGRFIGGL